MADAAEAVAAQGSTRRMPLCPSTDERLSFLSASFDPLLLLQQQAAAAQQIPAAGVALPNIRLAELLLPWGCQPQSIAAAATRAAAAAEEATAAGCPAQPHGPLERTKRSAFEAKLNAAKNKQLKTGLLLPQRLRLPASDASLAAARASPAGDLAGCGLGVAPVSAAGERSRCLSRGAHINQLRIWRQQKQQLEACVLPNALQLLLPESSKSCSCNSRGGVRVRGWLEWFDVNLTLLLQPAEFVAEEPQQQQQQQQLVGPKRRRVDWLLLP
ncbi:hypothetical protein Efla_000879 [Eimeria flavescens]